MMRHSYTQTTRWSRTRQLARAGVFASSGLILGRLRGRVLRHNGRDHLLVIASTQSGKTSCFVYPNMLTWQHSVIVHDPKDEIYGETAGWRSTFSQVVCLSPTRSTSGGYNVLDAIPLGQDQMMREVQLIAEALVEPMSFDDGKGSETEAHFTELAARALRGLILYGLYTQRARSLGALNALIRDTGWDDLLRDMATYPEAPVREIGVALRRIQPREFSGVMTTVDRALDLYGDALVQRATDRSSFALRDLRHRPRPMSLYLSIPFRDQARLRRWTRLVLNQVLNACLTSTTDWGHPMLGMIDEVPALRRFPLVSEGLNYFAGYGVRLALITPSHEELVKRFGVHHNFLEGCKIKLVFGMGDAKVAETFSRRVGMTERWKTVPTARGSRRERKEEPLLSSTAIMTLPEQQQLLIVGREKVIATKTFYRDHPLWLQRSQMRP